MTKDVGVANTGADREVDTLVGPVFTAILNGAQVSRQGLTEVPPPGR